ncbi:hypothetical protein D3C72_1673370 [compost metagenome]
MALCQRLKEEGDYVFDADGTALALCAAMEGLWLRLMMADGLTREKAHAAAVEYLLVAFPKHFTREGPK